MASIPQGSALKSAANTKPLSDQIRAMAKPLASLKITVTVFSLSMFLILIGSLAQARTDVWEVVGQYFRCWVAWIDVKDFFPPAFFPSLIEYNWDGLWINKACVKLFNRPQIPFFGGWTLGLVATINLLAAHGLRFKIQAKGQRLVAGVVTLAIGLVVTWFVVAGGMNADGFQSEPKLSYETVWQIFQVSVAVFCVGLGWQLWKHRSWITGGIGVLLVAVLFFAWKSEPLSEPSMRILWQLMKAQFASFVLLAACWFLFRKRSGVVLLHAGVAVLMLSEVLVGLTVSENRFQMWEGDTANYVFDLRERELVVVDNSGDKAEVVSIPESILLNAAASEGDARVIDDERLPFKIELVDFYRHSTLKNAKPDDENPANAGTGLKVVATELPKAGGMDSRSDESTAYVRLTSKKDDSDLGTYMLAMRLEGSYEPVLVGGKIYDLALRFKRTYKDYSVTLLDVAKRDYIGTTTPRDYSSEVRLVDEENGVDRKIRIWMNNPLRYRGETLYQTDYFLDTKTGRELSSLQVVNNRGWMLPYMACMIVLTGMAVQFGIVLLRYLRRREEAPLLLAKKKQSYSFSTVALCTALGLVVAGYFVSKARVPTPKAGEPNLFAFGAIPAVKSGRQQPLSSVAMNRMRVLTDGKSMFQRELRKSELMENWDEKSQEVAAAINGLEAEDLKGFKGDVPDLVKFISAGTEMHEQEVYGRLSQRNFFGSKSIITRKAPAIWWLLDQISQRPEASRHRIIRIDNPELKGTLNLEDRTPPMYCLAEVMEHYDELEKDLEQASAQFQKNSDNTTQYQRRLLELATNVSRMRQTQDVFSTLKYNTNRPHESFVRMADYKAVLDKMGAVSDSALVMPIPTPSEDVSKQWESYALATLRNEVLSFAKKKNVTTVDELVQALTTQLPDEVVVGEIDTTIQQLKTLPSNDSVNKVAAELIPRIGPEEFRIKEMLQLIADSDTDDAKVIVESLTDDKRDKLFNLGAANALLAMNDHVSTDAKSKMETVFRSGDVTKERVTELVELYTTEIAAKLFTDEQVAAGPSKDVTRLAAILTAWKDGETDDFNKLVAEHNENMASAEIAEIDTANTSFEAWYNNAAPASYGCVWYIIAFVLACASLIGWTRPLSRASFVIALVTFIFHTFALYARIEISGRPPVTNLYGSAVFIGWGAVLLGLIFEFIYKSGIGNLVATMTGGLTLFIAYYLGADGDTFEVLQAVLDTQFWLATHVVCITLGYSATFLAGMFGLVYILKGVFTKSLLDNDRKDLSRMIYGTICFAMLFSFVGTILGGLWADDSWGRFWGWDPKENGAMMIVIWNAILMHARWDNMIKDRGVAVLSVAGNIVTAWSWFGVNELKAGLHTYGFTEGRLFWLTMFVLSQLLVICIGLFPKDMWRSFGKPSDPTPA